MEEYISSVNSSRVESSRVNFRVEKRYHEAWKGGGESKFLAIRFPCSWREWVVRELGPLVRIEIPLPLFISNHFFRKCNLYHEMPDGDFPLICFADFQVEFARRDAGRRVEEDDGDVQVRGDERETLVPRADQKGQDGGGG